MTTANALVSVRANSFGPAKPPRLPRLRDRLETLETDPGSLRFDSRTSAPSTAIDAEGGDPEPK